MAVAPINIVMPLVSSLIAWRIYRRFRRNLGRQPLQTKRTAARIAIYCALSLVIGVLWINNSRMLLGMAAGAVVGVPLAFVGLRLTRFESLPEGRFYTPNHYMGAGLSLLLAGRLIYRLVILYGLSNVPASMPGAMQSPLTLFFFELLASYYIAYYIGVLIRCHSQPPSPPPVSLPPIIS